MALGYCAVCERLVAIIARELKHPGSDSRDRNWYPVPHVRQIHDDRCGGSIVADECTRCAAPADGLVLTPLHDCPGVKRPL